MKDWVVSIVFTVLITSIIGLIVPEGRLGKLIKGVFSFVILLVVIQPIFSISTENTDYVFPAVDIENGIQEDYIFFVNSKKVENMEKQCVRLIKENGYDSNVLIEYEFDNSNHISIKFVKIKLLNQVIKPDKEHIVVIEELTKSICSYLNIETNQVIFYE
ncbi:MAG: stage III sporulation protein AF [Clostridia bacterium]|nr:stage III sporulation protein AF [Clostridia bacterium]